MIYSYDIEREVNYWCDYFINEKYIYLKSLGLNRYQILEKYKKDLMEYKKNERDYYKLIMGLKKAINKINDK